MNRKSIKGVVKQVFSHLKEDEQDYKKGIREDKKLKKRLIKKVRKNG